jgi:hypothetical protein
MAEQDGLGVALRQAAGAPAESESKAKKRLRP